MEDKVNDGNSTRSCSPMGTRIPTPTLATTEKEENIDEDEISPYAPTSHFSTYTVPVEPAGRRTTQYERERGELEPPATPVPARTATPRSDYRNSYIQEEGENRSSYAPEGADYRSSYTPEGGDYRSSYTPPTWESDDREAPVISNQAFFDQITAINADIKEINEKIADITALHDTELATIDETERAEIEAETSAQTSELTSMNNAMTQRIKTLASETDLESDNSKHVQLVEKNFKKALQQYHECEVSYMRKMREMLARQYKITHPDATEEEVAEFVETAQTHEQVFVNGVLSSRLTEGRSALREANKRYQNIRKIERDMEQLADLFVELNELV